MLLPLKTQCSYATKKYNPNRKISDADIKTIVEAARLAPSSYGIQPYKVIVIGNQELKEKIYGVAWNQQIVKDCSHLMVFAAWDKYTKERIEAIFNHTTEERGIERGTAFGSHTAGIVASQYEMDEEAAFIDTAKQACISLGMAIAQAAELKIDNTPMGGFENKGLDAILDLESKGFKSVYLLSLGYRADEGDWLRDLKKVRTPINDFLDYRL